MTNGLQCDRLATLATSQPTFQLSAHCHGKEQHIGGPWHDPRSGLGGNEDAFPPDQRVADGLLGRCTEFADLEPNGLQAIAEIPPIDADVRTAPEMRLPRFPGANAVVLIRRAPPFNDRYHCDELAARA